MSSCPLNYHIYVSAPPAAFALRRRVADCQRANGQRRRRLEQMANRWRNDRCRYCCLFLRSKSTPMPSDINGEQKLGATAAASAAAALQEVNAWRAAKDEAPLTFDAECFQSKRLHYRDGAACGCTRLCWQLLAVCPRANGDQHAAACPTPFGWLRARSGRTRGQWLGALCSHAVAV